MLHAFVTWYFYKVDWKWLHAANSTVDYNTPQTCSTTTSQECKYFHIFKNMVYLPRPGPTTDIYSLFLNLLLLLICSIHSPYPLAFSMWFQLLKFSFSFLRKIFKLVFKLDHLPGFVMSCLFLSVFVGSCNCG